MTDKQDLKLVIALKSGDSNAFEKLFVKYYSRLYNFSFKMLRSREEAEGIVQTVFMKIWEMRSGLDENRSFGGYLFKIAQNKIYNLIRARINERFFRENLTEFALKFENQVEKYMDFRDLEKIMEDLINKLPDRRKEIFLLSRDEGLCYKEIARKLNITENTVDTQIRKVLDLFRNALREMYTSIKPSSK